MVLLSSTKDRFSKEEREKIIAEIKLGKIFIYPTDTIYGLGCDATNSGSVNKIREIKKREGKPFLIVVPSLEWIFANCEMSEKNRKIISDKLPGPYSFFLKLKNKSDLAYKELVPSEDGTIGVRLLKHPFQEIIAELGRPFVTTSVNFTGSTPATSLETFPEEIKEKVDYIIYEGPREGTPSTRINLT